MSRRVLIVIVVLFGTIGARPVVAVPLSIESAVRTLRGGASIVVAGEQICAAHPLPLFYERRDYAPAWNGVEAESMVLAIYQAGDDGLDPADYHRDAILALGRDPASTPERDLLLTDAFFLLTSHLLSGRVDPVTVERTWCLEPRASDLVPALETALRTHDVPRVLARFRSSHDGYIRLRDHLARYRKMEEWSPVDPGRALREGSRGPRVEQLAARLGLPSRAVFDAPLAEAVRQFQRTHSLDVDGVVSRDTLRELNIPLADRIRTLEVNLERWRWLPETLGERHVLINIPQFELAVVERGNTVLTMRLIVGKDYAHRTPVFSSQIEEIVFSPYWNVPESIAVKELWPKQRRDGTYFAREHIEVLSGGGLRQKPGPWNALGLIKFNLPNRYTVYLHDTPTRGLFSRTVRTFSHGCMRIEKPVELAAYLLRDDDEWTVAAIAAQSKRGAEHAVKVKNPLPVHVLYWTAYVSEDGTLHFAPDVYGRDSALDVAMRRPVPQL
jgi:L,D-transpeptidase YcbB